jgi:hypothetical protein
VDEPELKILSLNRFKTQITERERRQPAAFFQRPRLVSFMFIYHASRALLAFPLARITIECSRWGSILIAIIAVLAVDGLLATGAWYVVGSIIGD